MKASPGTASCEITWEEHACHWVPSSLIHWESSQHLLGRLGVSAGTHTWTTDRKHEGAVWEARAEAGFTSFLVTVSNWQSNFKKYGWLCMFVKKRLNMKNGQEIWLYSQRPPHPTLGGISKRHEIWHCKLNVTCCIKGKGNLQLVK